MDDQPSTSKDDEMRQIKEDIIRRYKTFVEQPRLLLIFGETIRDLVQNAYYNVNSSDVDLDKLNLMRNYLKVKKKAFLKKILKKKIIEGEMMPKNIEFCDLVESDEEELTEVIPWKMPRRALEVQKNLPSKVNSSSSSSSRNDQHHQPERFRQFPPKETSLFDPRHPPPGSANVCQQRNAQLPLQQVYPQLSQLQISSNNNENQLPSPHFQRRQLNMNDKTATSKDNERTHLQVNARKRSANFTANCSQATSMQNDSRSSSSACTSYAEYRKQKRHNENSTCRDASKVSKPVQGSASSSVQRRSTKDASENRNSTKSTPPLPPSVHETTSVTSVPPNTNQVLPENVTQPAISDALSEPLIPLDKIKQEPVTTPMMAAEQDSEVSPSSDILAAEVKSEVLDFETVSNSDLTETESLKSDITDRLEDFEEINIKEEETHSCEPEMVLRCRNVIELLDNLPEVKKEQIEVEKINESEVPSQPSSLASTSTQVNSANSPEGDGDAQWYIPPEEVDVPFDNDEEELENDEEDLYNKDEDIFSDGMSENGIIPYFPSTKSK